MQTATVKWIGREEFLATMPSGHAVPFDADRKHNSAPGPMEMLLGALGACTSVDVSLHPRKKTPETRHPRNRNFRRTRQRPAFGLDQNRNGLPPHRPTR